jgi:alanine racemase
MPRNYEDKSFRLNNNTSALLINTTDINLTQLKRNVRIIKDQLKARTKFMAVVKANAYGHGLVRISSEMEKIGCDYLGVARLSEAVQLRENGVVLPILVFLPIIPSQAVYAIEGNITLLIDNADTASDLNKIAFESNSKLKIHIKVNTGLNRYGCDKLETLDLVKYIVKACPNLYLEGICTHFRDGEYDREFTKFQIREFDRLIMQLENEKLRPEIVHASSSIGILAYPEAHYDMVRCGLILYGLELLEDEKCLPKGMKSIMSIKSRILKIREIKSGEYSGYGNRFQAERDSTIAVVGIGYGDGISRNWKEVLIAGQKLPVVNYCMDSIIVDITDAKAQISEFDEVVIIGKQQNESISWEQACKSVDTSADEQLQKITERVYRNYYYEN